MSVRPVTLAVVLAVGLAVALGGAGGCYNHIQKQCPDCTVLTRERPTVPVRDGTRVVFLLVPGILGFGWEWDGPVATIRHAPDVALQVFDWSPGSTLTRVTADFADTLNALWSSVPPSVERIVVVGHSAGGLVTAQASSRFQTPPGRETLVVNIGAPYAGLGITGESYDGISDFVHSPFATALGMQFVRYPRPADGTVIESWITSATTDPVMRSRNGHHPDDPAVGPPGKRIRLPDDADHNRFLATIVENLVQRVVGATDTMSRRR